MAVSDIEIDRRVEVAIVEFLNHVRSDDSHLRCAMCYKGCNIESADANQPHILVFTSETQRAIAFVVKFGSGHHACARHYGQGLVEDAPFGHGKS